MSDVRSPAAAPDQSHAIVIGASMAGLLAARVLSEHFDRVTIIERDQLPTGIAHRSGVPQARHAHALLPGGERALNRRFPDLSAALLEHGAVMANYGQELRWFHFGAYKARYQSDLDGLYMSRPLLEGLIRQRVLARPNVVCRDQLAVASLVTADDQQRVTGVQLDARPARGQGETLAADLVVDASGRNSRAPTWLDELGYGRPAESEVTVNFAYTTRLYRRQAGDLPDGVKAAFLMPHPPRGRTGGALFPIEDDRWIVTLGGWLNTAAPADDAGFAEFARKLPTSLIYDVVRRAEPVSDYVGYRFKSSVRRHYERLARFPHGFLVIGDAICSFNPIYGQGMTVSAAEMDALDTALREGWRGSPERFAAGYFNRVSRVVDVPWLLATGEDFRFPEVTGPKPPGTDFVNWYVGRLHQVATVDPVVCDAFYQVAGLMAPPLSLFGPNIAWRVLRPRALWPRRRQHASR